MWALFVLGAIAATAERQTVAINDRTEMSVAFLPLVFSAVAFGPLGGFAVGALSTALDLRTSPLKWSVYTPIRGLTAAAAGLVVARLVPQPNHLGQYLLASLVGSLVFLAADGFFSTATGFVRGNDPVAHLRAIRIAVVAHGAPLRSGSDALRLRIPHLLAGARARLLRSDACCAKAAPPLPRRDGTRQADSPRQTIVFAEPASRSPLPSLRRWMPGISTQRVTLPLSRSMQETSRSGWAYRTTTRNSSTSAASCTTLARSGFPLACSRSPVH